MQIRPYQEKIQQETIAAWNAGYRRVMMVMPTGAGKTLTKSDLIRKMGMTTCCIAHRQELVLQISESLASCGIFHNIIAPTEVVRFCVERHAKKFGRSFFRADAKVAVSAVQTLTRRADKLRNFLNSVQLWDIDEAHHVLPHNTWGRACGLFPNAIGLGVTATPLRCDRQGLDRSFDHMVVGPSMRDLINAGYLTEYRIFCPPVSIDLERVRVSDSTGEFVARDLSEEVERSQIVGDVVAHYLRIAPGGRGLTFAVDLASAGKIADAFNAAGVPAAVVSGDTPDRIRADLLDRLARGDIKQLVNVDLFGEGMDCPTLEVVSMARPTQSYGLFVQQFGRVLRPAPGKTHGIVIDHVGNVLRHGLPDAPRAWSLAAPERRRRKEPDPDAIPITACTACFQPYPRTKVACPWCGNRPEPVGRSLPEQVDGDLIELDPAVLAKMRGEADRIMGDPQVPVSADALTDRAIRNRWAERQTAQNQLRQTIAEWAGVWKYGRDETDREIQRRFFHSFGVDILTAQGLNAADAGALRAKVLDAMNRAG